MRPLPITSAIFAAALVAHATSAERRTTADPPVGGGDGRAPTASDPADGGNDPADGGNAPALAEAEPPATGPT